MINPSGARSARPTIQLGGKPTGSKKTNWLIIWWKRVIAFFKWLGTEEGQKWLKYLIVPILVCVFSGITGYSVHQEPSIWVVSGVTFSKCEMVRDLSFPYGIFPFIQNRQCFARINDEETGIPGIALFWDKDEGAKVDSGDIEDVISSNVNKNGSYTMIVSGDRNRAGNLLPNILCLVSGPGVDEMPAFDHCTSYNDDGR